MEIRGGRYGLKDGICEACGFKMKGHPKCEACGILAGLGHDSYLEDYRGHQLCDGCKNNWLRIEKKNKKTLDWRGFITHGWSKAELNR